MASQPKKKSVANHLIAGGTAGLMEALVCHPLDTIKVLLPCVFESLHIFVI
ncbi:hypothetical protein HMI55_006547 [Coelomomyces lativittatus]|nr:hypothetical protein HMI56_005786 [Coelomomyces lativittatus]KAJ1518344.1 hypothetical protein HMI55_006547 [Coelomomyces lativittatus]